MGISIVIPVFNDGKTLGKTIETAKKAFHEAEIMVVDDGSTDGSAEVARKAGVCVIVHRKNRGKGAAMKSGVKKASNRILLFFDADIKNASCKMLRKMAAPVLNSECEATIGTFQSPFPQTFTERVYRPLVRKYFPEVDKAIRNAPLSGQRVMLKRIWKKLSLPNGFGVEAAMNIDFVVKSVKFKAVEIGKINPVFKGVLGKRVIDARAKQISSAILVKAKQYGRKNRL